MYIADNFQFIQSVVRVFRQFYSLAHRSRQLWKQNSHCSLTITKIKKRTPWLNIKMFFLFSLLLSTIFFFFTCGLSSGGGGSVTPILVFSLQAISRMHKHFVTTVQSGHSPTIWKHCLPIFMNVRSGKKSITKKIYSYDFGQR